MCVFLCALPQADQTDEVGEFKVEQLVRVDSALDTRGVIIRTSGPPNLPDPLLAPLSGISRIRFIHSSNQTFLECVFVLILVV